MRLLKVTLILKIVLTIGWSGSLLLLSGSQFKDLGMPEPTPILFARLLGAAFLALLVGYALGLRELLKGHVPFNTMVVGIVSNGLACFLLLCFGLAGTWNEWGGWARYCLWGSAMLTGLITGMLIVSVLLLGSGRARQGGN